MFFGQGWSRIVDPGVPAIVASEVASVYWRLCARVFVFCSWARWSVEGVCGGGAWRSREEKLERWWEEGGSYPVSPLTYVGG